MANTCESCGKELLAGGSIVFTPPESGAREKHLCLECFEKLHDDKSSGE